MLSRRLMYKPSVLLASVSSPFRMHSLASSVSNQAANASLESSTVTPPWLEALPRSNPPHPANYCPADDMPTWEIPNWECYTFINEPYIRSMSSKSVHDLFLVRLAPYVIHTPVELTAFRLQCAIFRYRIYENRLSG